MQGPASDPHRHYGSRSCDLSMKGLCVGAGPVFVAHFAFFDTDDAYRVAVRYTLGMKRIVLFEDEGFVNLLPLVYWRSVFELRFGRSIILDRMAQKLQSPISGIWTRDWIAKVAQQRCLAPANVGVDGQTVLVNGRWVVEDVVEWGDVPRVGLVGDEVAYIVCDDTLAHQLTPNELLNAEMRADLLERVPHEEASGSMIRYPWDLTSGLGDRLTCEFDENLAGIEPDLDPRVCLEEESLIRIGPCTKIHPTAAISAAAGPVDIAEDVYVGAHAVIEGPVHIGAGCRINPHAWLHGGNSFGAVCKIGGEVDGCIFQSFSNKQHDGFLGHSFVGNWVNLGAGTVNSDLKNTYGSVRVPINGTEVNSDETFFGCVIGDFVKTGINTIIPTGAVLGLASVVATGRVLDKFVPSFGWLTDKGLGEGDANRLLDVAAKVLARRGRDMTDEEVELFLDIPARAAQYERLEPAILE